MSPLHLEENRKILNYVLFSRRFLSGVIFTFYKDIPYILDLLLVITKVFMTGDFIYVRFYYVNTRYIP